MADDVAAHIRAPRGGQSAIVLRRLCPACLSVITRQDFERKRCYPHHRSLKRFLEASSMGCYICSWMFEALPISHQEVLMARAEDRISDNMVALDSDDSTSNHRADFRDSLQREQTVWSVKWGSRVSFTGMVIAQPINVGDEADVSILLHPSYKGYFPPNTTLYDGWLKNFWEDMVKHTESTWDHGLAFISHESTKPRETTV